MFFFFLFDFCIFLFVGWLVCLFVVFSVLVRPDSGRFKVVKDQQLKFCIPEVRDRQFLLQYTLYYF